MALAAALERPDAFVADCLSQSNQHDTQQL
jgi:hypothetical protein